MSAARLFRPLARAVERQAFAAPMGMRTAAKVAPFTPSFNGQKYTVAQKTEAKMVRSTRSPPAVGSLHHKRASSTIRKKATGNANFFWEAPAN